ncbi:cysteine proteinase inhibitor 4-like [Nicotiana sylvestris]|uniref:Cysteine proteinase inhibitor 4-like n=1 Tax=Nicotiana sylvestris TaxID=4096 RepID=A0A1U7X7Q5_NICSY|nr:PREDICTED: cysteine proteinase inhibitor 4-like [Nicotiana sylvestris]
MAQQFNFLLLSCLSVIVVASSFFHVSSARSGLRHNFLDSEKPIKNPNDPTVVGIATFAVNEHNKESKSNFQLVRVMTGGTDVIPDGTVYQLEISASESNIITTRLVAVLVHPDNVKELISFE